MPLRSVSHEKGPGLYWPISTRLTCYRFGDGREDHGSCSYFAPLTRFPITPGRVVEYDVYLTLGSVEEIRGSFEQLHQRKHSGR